MSVERRKSLRACGVGRRWLDKNQKTKKKGTPTMKIIIMTEIVEAEVVEETE